MGEAVLDNRKAEKAASKATNANANSKQPGSGLLGVPQASFKGAGPNSGMNYFPGNTGSNELDPSFGGFKPSFQPAENSACAFGQPFSTDNMSPINNGGMNQNILSGDKMSAASVFNVVERLEGKHADEEPVLKTYSKQPTKSEKLHIVANYDFQEEYGLDAFPDDTYLQEDGDDDYEKKAYVPKPSAVASTTETLAGTRAPSIMFNVPSSNKSSIKTRKSNKKPQDEGYTLCKCTLI